MRQHPMLPQDNRMVGPKNVLQGNMKVTLGQIDILSPPLPKNLLLVHY